MRCLYRVGHFERQPERLVRYCRTRKRLTFNVLKNQVIWPDVMHLTNMRMVESGNCPAFLLESRTVLSLESLNGHDTHKSGIARLPHFSHATGTDELEQLIWAHLCARLHSLSIVLEERGSTAKGPGGELSIGVAIQLLDTAKSENAWSPHQGEAGSQLLLFRSRYHDLNPNAWMPERCSNTSTHGRILSINPIVPKGVVIVKITPIRQPHLGNQKFRLVGTSHLQKLVDTIQHLSGLHLHVTDWAGWDTAETNDAVMHDGIADDRDDFHARNTRAFGCSKSFNAHFRLLLFSEWRELPRSTFFFCFHVCVSVGVTSF